MLSTLIPGSGQVLAGYRLRGGIMIAVSIVIIAGVLAAWAQGTSTMLSWIVQPRVLVSIFVLNLLVLAFRVGSVVDAYWSPRPIDGRKPAGWHRGLVAVGLSALLLITAAPHAVLGYYTYLTYDTLNQVFNVEAIADDLEEQQSSTPEPAATEAPTPEPSPTPETDSRSMSHTTAATEIHGDRLSKAPRANLPRRGPSRGVFSDYSLGLISRPFP